MRESIGSVFLYNMIIVFIAIVFAILTTTLIYYKAFKVNTRILNSIEKYEGYNNLALTEITNSLVTIGYMPQLNSNKDCPKTKNGGTLVNKGTESHHYCVYENTDDSKHYSYGVITYVTLDIPIVQTFLRIPIYSKSNVIYKFGA